MDSKIQSLPSEYLEIYNNFIMPVDTSIRFSSVILSDENKYKFNLFINELKHKDELHNYNLQPMNRILMYGASGTGKTYSTKALCNELGYTMIYIDIAKALSDDTVAKNISDIFKLANYMKNCLIMLDECDSVAWQRDTGNSDTGTIRRATNCLFQQLDQMNDSNIFVAATNMLYRLDAAFERRFDLKMEFLRPKVNLKEAMRKFMHPGFEFIDDVDSTTESILARRSSQNTKLSYFEIQCVVERAMKDAILNNKREVRTSDLYKSLALNMKIKLRFHIEDTDDINNTSNVDRYNN